MIAYHSELRIRPETLQQFNKLLFVQVDDLYIAPIWLEVDRLLALPAGVRIHGEILLEHVVVVVGQSIFIYPIDRLMNLHNYEKTPTYLSYVTRSSSFGSYPSRYLVMV